MKTPLIALAATATLMAGAPALAEEAGDTMVVVYDDLDLGSDAGQKTLNQRIDAAAKKFCGVGDVQTGTRLTSKSSSKCFKEARKIARQAMAPIVRDSQLGG